MNINILKEFRLIFYKNLINIIFNHSYINYTFKITLTLYFILFYHFLEFFQAFS